MDAADVRNSGITSIDDLRPKDFALLQGGGFYYFRKLDSGGNYVELTIDPGLITDIGHNEGGHFEAITNGLINLGFNLNNCPALSELHKRVVEMEGEVKVDNMDF